MEQDVCIYLTPQPWIEYDTKSVFKWNTASLNSEFSFSYTDCLTRDKEPNVLFYLPTAVRRTDGFIMERDVSRSVY